MPRLKNAVTGVIVNVDDATAKSLNDTAAAGEWVDADKAEKPARRARTNSDD